MCFDSTRNRKFQKNSRKIKKSQKTPSQLLSKPKQVRNGVESQKIKKKSFRWVSLPDPEQKTSKKNSRKIQKIRKHHHSFFPSQNRLGKVEKEGKKKKSFRFAPTQPGIENIKQIAEKIQKIREHHHSFFLGQNTMGKVEKE